MDEADAHRLYVQLRQTDAGAKQKKVCCELSQKLAPVTRVTAVVFPAWVLQRQVIALSAGPWLLCPAC